MTRPRVVTCALALALGGLHCASDNNSAPQTQVGGDADVEGAAGSGGAGGTGGKGTSPDGATPRADGGADATMATTDSGGAGMMTAADGGSCATDPLHTGLVAQQTGVNVDSFDCSILKWTAANHEPDPMIFKAIIYVESRFDHTSVACPNKPCGTPTGWTDAETGCFGLMQIVLSCGGDPNMPGLLPDGHPDLEMDMTAADWSGSVFNPDVNIEIGIAGVADNRAQVVQKFPGCTDDQYTMMAIGDYNSYGSTKSCTVFNTDYDKLVLDAYTMYSTAAGYAAHPYSL